MPSVMTFTCCLILVLTMFIAESNGKWKSKNRETLQKDIAKFQEMAEKIEEEIEDIYDEYADDWTNNQDFIKEEDVLENNINKKLSTSNKIGNTTNKITVGIGTSTPKNVLNDNVTPKIGNINEIRSPEKANVINSKWPKFEDILLEMGIKYDWKNDRWIKVKKKINQSSEDNHLTFNERRKFRYKTVKLHRSKSRRNIVIAVTAVR